VVSYIIFNVSRESSEEAPGSDHESELFIASVNGDTETVGLLLDRV
jgi:hypothetical protein